MNKALKIIFVCLVVIGAAIAVFSDVPIVEYSGLAVACVSAGLACIAIWKKSEKKDWKVIVSIVLIAVGSIGCVIAGVAGDTITQIIAAVAGIVSLITGLIVSIVGAKKSKK